MKYKQESQDYEIFIHKWREFIIPLIFILVVMGLFVLFLVAVALFIIAKYAQVI